MPKKMHDALKKQAKKMGLLGDKRDRYIFGTMSKLKKQGKIK